MKSPCSVQRIAEIEEGAKYQPNGKVSHGKTIAFIGWRLFNFIFNDVQVSAFFRSFSSGVSWFCSVTLIQY